MEAEGYNHGISSKRNQFMPLHSIIMPAHNAAGTISYSVSSVLAQTEKDFELIIVDDASTDNSFDIYSAHEANPKIKILRHTPNSGPGACRNIGMDIACGRYLHFLDSDDLMLPSLLKTLSVGHEELGYSMCCAPYIRAGVFRSAHHYATVTTPPSLIDKKLVMKYNAIPILTASIDRARCILPRFEERVDNSCLSRPEDYLFWLRMFEINPGLVCRLCPTPCAIYRVSKKSRSANKYATLRRLYEIFSSQGQGGIAASACSLRWSLLASRGKSLWEILDHLIPG
jgi:glycosyltransferase involved in cell wall biosynthesis